MKDKDKLKTAIDYIQWVLDQIEIDTREAQDKAIKTLKVINNQATEGEFNYELTILVRQEENLIDVLEDLERLTTKVYVSDIQTYKRLAYPIQGEEFADYYYLELEMPERNCSMVSHYLDVKNKVLRYLLVKKGRQNEQREI